MQNQALQFISQEKDLGVIFISIMSLDAHVNDNVSNKILGLIRRPFTCLDEVTLVQLYEPFVGPHLKFLNCV